MKTKGYVHLDDGSHAVDPVFQGDGWKIIVMGERAMIYIVANRESAVRDTFVSMYPQVSFKDRLRACNIKVEFQPATTPHAYYADTVCGDVNIEGPMPADNVTKSEEPVPGSDVHWHGGPPPRGRSISVSAASEVEVGQNASVAQVDG